MNDSKAYMFYFIGAEHPISCVCSICRRQQDADYDQLEVSGEIKDLAQKAADQPENRLTESEIREWAERVAEQVSGAAD